MAIVVQGKTVFGPRLDNFLILNLDAGNPSSYPGSGTTWFDLTSNNNNGILINGPTFDSGNGGSITFDGIDDYVDCGDIEMDGFTGLTVEAWCKSNIIDSNPRRIVSKDQRS